MGSMDSSHVALVSLLLRESAFSEFKCDRPTSLGMNVDSLGKILKMCGQSDSLKLKWLNDADTVTFQCESGEEDRIAEFQLKLMQIESSIWRSQSNNTRSLRSCLRLNSRRYAGI